MFLDFFAPPVEQNINQFVNSGGKEFKTPRERNVDIENNKEEYIWMASSIFTVMCPTKVCKS